MTTQEKDVEDMKQATIEFAHLFEKLAVEARTLLLAMKEKPITSASVLALLAAEYEKLSGATLEAAFSITVIRATFETPMQVERNGSWESVVERTCDRALSLVK